MSFFFRLYRLLLGGARVRHSSTHLSHCQLYLASGARSLRDDHDHVLAELVPVRLSFITIAGVLHCCGTKQQVNPQQGQGQEANIPFYIKL